MNITIIGAGALGRGLIYPLCAEQGHDIWLVDKEAGRAEEWEAVWVGAGTNSQRYMCTIETRITQAPDLVFTCVPPGNIPQAAIKLRDLGPGVPVVCLENIKDPAGLYRKNVPGCHLINGIAWVSAFRERKAIPVLREQQFGTMDRFYADAGMIEVEEEIPLQHQRLRVMDDYERSYEMKLLLHNAPHAVIAYIGWKQGAETIPEAFRRRQPDYDELFQALTYLYPGQSVQISREYARFSSPTFPDVIERVARAPARKLMRGERLPALYHALRDYPRAQKIVRHAIDCAIDYGEQNDPLICLWVQQNGWTSLIKDFCGLEWI